MFKKMGKKLVKFLCSSDDTYEMRLRMLGINLSEIKVNAEKEQAVINKEEDK